MTRRELLASLAALVAEGITARAQSSLSTRGRFLNWSDEEERYWFFGARDGLERFRRLSFAHRGQCELRELARSATGLPVFAIRLGSGTHRVALLSGMHGCEPSGPRGLLAYLDALLNNIEPFGIAAEPAKVLKAVTIDLIPLLNPGGGDRFSKHFPDCWHGTWLNEWNEANKQRFFAEGNEPVHFFYGTYVKKPPMRFTPEQIALWEATGNVLGSSLTDGGLDVWFDWEKSQGVETRAAKELLKSARPQTIMDIHNFMFPTEVFAPTVYSHGAFADQEQSLALSVQKAWRSQKLPFHDRPPRPYPKPAEKSYEDYWFHQLGARTLIVEVNGGLLATEGSEYEPTPGARPLTRQESLEAVVVGVDALVRSVAAGL